MKLELVLQKLGLIQPGKIMYIGGSDVLPAPLRPEDERRAIEALAAGDETARQTLIEHNLRLVVYIARRFEYCLPTITATIPGKCCASARRFPFMPGRWQRISCACSQSVAGKRTK